MQCTSSESESTSAGLWLAERAKGDGVTVDVKASKYHPWFDLCIKLLTFSQES